MRVVCVADTHGLHRQLEVPGGNLLVHAGDFTFNSEPPSVVSDFNAWLGAIPHRHKVVVPGNHEFVLEEPRNRGAITNAILLIDSGVEVEGISIWGSPVTPLYGDAFGKSRPEDRQRHWAQVPEGLDILITHGPPFAILDHGGSAERREGCPYLFEPVFRARPRLHVFGHIHAGYGTLWTSNTVFVNASLLGGSGSLDREPIVIDLQAR
jgi:Icc-related predicted phosphoesterase